MGLRRHMMLEIELGGRRRNISIAPVPGESGRFLATLDGVSSRVDWHRVAEGRYSLVFLDDRRTSHDVEVTSTPDRHVVDIHVDGGAFRAAFGGRRRGRPGRGSDAGPGGDPRVVAPMPGRVVRVLVDVGQDVTIGQGLVVVEAMKMENELRAPWAGRVAEIGVAEGVSVQAGRVLVVLDRPARRE